MKPMPMHLYIAVVHNNINEWKSSAATRKYSKGDISSYGKVDDSWQNIYYYILYYSSFIVSLILLCIYFNHYAYITIVMYIYIFLETYFFCSNRSCSTNLRSSSIIELPMKPEMQPTEVSTLTNAPSPLSQHDKCHKSSNADKDENKCHWDSSSSRQK